MTIFNKYGLFLQFGTIIFGGLLVFMFMIWGIRQLSESGMFFLGISFGLSLTSILNKKITTSTCISKND